MLSVATNYREVWDQFYLRDMFVGVSNILESFLIPDIPAHFVAPLLVASSQRRFFIVSLSIVYSVSRSVGQSVSRSIGRSLGRSVGRSVARSVSQSVR